MATKKSTHSDAPEMIQELVHCCNGFMYIVPRQENSVWEDIESYVVTFRSDYSSKRLPEDVQTSKHKFCPYCGELLFKLEKASEVNSL